MKDFKVNNLIEEYRKYSLLFVNYQSHIDKCYEYNIINIKERNNYLKQINDLIKQLNLAYNVTMMEFCNNTNDGNKMSVDDKKINNCKSLIDIHKVIGINSYDDPYKEISEQLLKKLGAKIGFPSIKTGLSIIIGDQYSYSFNTEINDMINFYDKIFVPLECNVGKIKGEKQTIYAKTAKMDNIVLLDNCANICIQNDDQRIILSGYFIPDSLNVIIRTSQLSNNFLYQKKKDCENFVLSKNDIGENFVKSYIKNMQICDILTLTNEELYNKIRESYILYNKLIKLSFIHLMREFIKDENDVKLCIDNMYNIIKLLLLGSDESINIAGLLFGITKEKKIGFEFSISDIIYKNLSYCSQIKLRKATINIKLEMDKIKAMAIDEIDLKKQIIICKNMPDIVKKAAFEKVEEMKNANNEYYKQLMYVRTLLNFPWPSNDDDTFFSDIGKNKIKSKNFLDNVIKNLNDKVYGHIECKESIKELIGKWICNPSSPGSAIGLAGPPGVGKTLIAKAIGDALNIPFVQITLGGQNDGDLLHGHGYTYSGSQPGMIIKKMVEAGSARCIMYFDELDKACKRYDSNEIYNILIHITDPNTNTEFQDRFFQEIKFPLNKVLFIFSYNDSSIIDNILMDRIKEIEVKPFKTLDKKIILNKFLIKEMCELVGFEDKSISFDEEITEFIINRYTNEPGVRDLKRKLEKIFLKLNIDRIYGSGVFEKTAVITKEKPINLTKELIENYLGKNTVHIQCIHTENLVGVINGMYATDSGHGGILPIQIFDNYTNGDDKFTLKLTGSQRRVMRESVISAFTCAIHCIKEEIRNDYFRNHPGGMHIHAIGTATPKNGPSGGSAFTVGFISRILNKKIRCDVALTGEIELTGKITKIGGLQYKLNGAKRAGVKIAFVPKENSDDVETITKEYEGLVNNDFKIILVDNLKEVLKYVLIDFDPNQIN